MKITGVRTQPYAFELARPIGDANLPQGGSISRGPQLEAAELAWWGEVCGGFVF